MSKPAAPPAKIDALAADWFGFFKVHLGRIDSTSDEAARRLRANALRPPAVVVADVQTAGRGTRGRTWHSADESECGASLTATFALPRHESRPIHHLPLLAGLAVRDALAEVAGPAADDRLQIKWPNDVLLDGRKLAGLLCERRDGADLVGVGVNLTPVADALPTDLRDRVASLAEVRPASRDAALAAVARRFAADLLSNSATLAARIGDLRRHDFLLGRRVSVRTNAGSFAGECRGIDNDGRLLVENGRVRRVSSGTISLVDEPQKP